MALAGGDRERLHAPALDVVGHGAEVLEGKIDLVAHDVGLAGGAALVGDVHRIGPGHLLQQLRSEVV
jgi:hypothetical protein